MPLPAVLMNGHKSYSNTGDRSRSQEFHVSMCVFYDFPLQLNHQLERRYCSPGRSQFSTKYWRKDLRILANLGFRV